MNPLVLGYVLTALACTKAGDKVTKHCVDLPHRAAPVGLYACQRRMAVAAERVPETPVKALNLRPGAYHFTFECKPVTAERPSV